MLSRQHEWKLSIIPERRDTGSSGDEQTPARGRVREQAARLCHRVRRLADLMLRLSPVRSLLALRHARHRRADNEPRSGSPESLPEVDVTLCEVRAIFNPRTKGA